MKCIGDAGDGPAGIDGNRYDSIQVEELRTDFSNFYRVWVPVRKAMRNFLLGLGAIVSLAACSKEPEPAVPNADVDAGKALAAARCAGCHGMDGRGAESDIPNLAAQPAEYLAEALHAYRDGKREHAALRDMTLNMNEEDILNIAAYYASQPPVVAGSAGKAPTSHDSIYQEGAEIAAICEACHGKRGYSVEPGTPSLAGQQPAYLIVSTQEYVKGKRGHEEKEEMLRGLQQIDIEKMAMYFAAQVPPLREAPGFGDPVRGEPLSAACGECHGARGNSHDPLVPSLAGQEPHYLVNAIKAYRTHEREHKDMVTDKSDEQIEHIAAYYAVQAAEPAVDESSEVRELAAKCNRCHGAAAARMTMAVPSLNGQSREYLIRVMKAYRDDERGSSMMHKMSSNYRDPMIEAIASYYSNQPAN